MVTPGKQLPSKMTLRITLIAFACMLIAPAGARAATVFGADLNQDPTNSTAHDSVTNLTLPGTASDVAPVSGVFTAVRIRTAGNGGTGVIRILSQTSHPDATTYGFLNAAPEIPVTVTADPSTAGHVTEVLTRRPIAAGQRLAWYIEDNPTGSVHSTYIDAAATCAYLLPGTQPVGTSADYTTSGCGNGAVMIAGTIEPDADNDGFGDETQDKCVGTAGTFNGCPSEVTLGKPKAKKGKKIIATATVPGAGTLSAGVPSDPAVATAAKGRPLRPVTQTLTATTRQQVRLVLKLTKGAKKKLRRKGKLGLKLRVVYTPSGGPASSQTRKVKLKSKKK